MTENLTQGPNTAKQIAGQQQAARATCALPASSAAHSDGPERIAGGEDSPEKQELFRSGAWRPGVGLGTGIRARSGVEPYDRIAEIVAEHSGEALTSAKEAIARGARPAAVESARDRGRSGARRARIDGLAAQVQRRFAGKISLGSQLGGLRNGEVACAADAMSAEAAACGRDNVRGLVRDALGGGRPARLTRTQRRVLVRAKRREADVVARRYVGATEPERAGVWSREVYRRIRAGVQDASGRAAQCLLYMLGTEEAVRLAEQLDARVPMDRRKIALWYAVNTAPGSDLGDRVKLGFALGLWSAVLADPNNPNMERRRRFQPSRRTLSTDLSWLQERGIVKRWQVHADVAAPCEMKRGPYPTNRYFARQTRAGGALLAISLALGDVPPAQRPNPSEQWSTDDAAALEEVRALLLAELQPAPEGPRERPS
jgi:hypothetical protein